MIGRLVEQQHVGFGEQQLRQLDAHPPTAREARERSLAIGLREAESREHARHARGALEAAARREARAQLVPAMGEIGGRVLARVPERLDLRLDGVVLALPARRDGRGQLATSSPTLRGASGSISWRRRPTRVRRGSSTRPASGGSSPASSRSSVLLPEPFGPTRPMRSPARTSSVTPSKSRRPATCLATPSARSSTARNLAGVVKRGWGETDTVNGQRGRQGSDGR